MVGKFVVFGLVGDRCLFVDVIEFVYNVLVCCFGVFVIWGDEFDVGMYCMLFV